LDVLIEQKNKCDKKDEKEANTCYLFSFLLLFW